jgi:hypothetical protein
MPTLRRFLIHWASHVTEMCPIIKFTRRSFAQAGHAYAPAVLNSLGFSCHGNVSDNQIHPPELRAGGPPKKKKGVSPWPLCLRDEPGLEGADLSDKAQ